MDNKSEGVRIMEDPPEEKAAKKQKKNRKITVEATISRKSVVENITGVTMEGVKSDMGHAPGVTVDATISKKSVVENTTEIKVETNLNKKSKTAEPAKLERKSKVDTVDTKPSKKSMAESVSGTGVEPNLNRASKAPEPANLDRKSKVETVDGKPSKKSMAESVSGTGVEPNLNRASKAPEPANLDRKSKVETVDGKPSKKSMAESMSETGVEPNLNRTSKAPEPVNVDRKSRTPDDTIDVRTSKKSMGESIPEAAVEPNLNRRSKTSSTPEATMDTRGNKKSMSERGSEKAVTPVPAKRSTGATVPEITVETRNVRSKDGKKKTPEVIVETTIIKKRGKNVNELQPITTEKFVTVGQSELVRKRSEGAEEAIDNAECHMDEECSKRKKISRVSICESVTVRTVIEQSEPSQSSKSTHDSKTPSVSKAEEDPPIAEPQPEVVQGVIGEKASDSINRSIRSVPRDTLEAMEAKASEPSSVKTDAEGSGQVEVSKVTMEGKTSESITITTVVEQPPEEIEQVPDDPSEPITITTTIKQADEAELQGMTENPSESMAIKTVIEQPDETRTMELSEHDKPGELERVIGVTHPQLITITTTLKVPKFTTAPPVVSLKLELADVIKLQKYKLTYFNITALGEPIRFLLCYGEVEFEDARIDLGSGVWEKVKPELPMGQVPVLQINDEMIHQHLAICRYFGKKFGLAGDNDWETLLIDVVADTINDFRMKLVPTFWETNLELREKNFRDIEKTTIPYYLQKMEVTAESGYFANYKLSWVDLYFVALLDYFNALVRFPIDNFYPNLRRVRDNVYRIPQIMKWLQSRPVTKL